MTGDPGRVFGSVGLGVLCAVALGSVREAAGLAGETAFDGTYPLTLAIDAVAIGAGAATGASLGRNGRTAGWPWGLAGLAASLAMGVLLWTAEAAYRRCALQPAGCSYPFDPIDLVSWWKLVPPAILLGRALNRSQISRLRPRSAR